MSKESHPTHRPMSMGQRWFYRFCTILAWLGVQIWHRLSVYGQANVPKTGPVLIAANHPSYLDPPLMSLVLPRIARFMGKIELFKVPVLGQYLAAIGVFAVNRAKGQDALEYATKLLTQGELVVMYPEARRSWPTGRMRRPHKGVILLAIWTGAPIIPTAVIGTHKAMPKGTLLPRPNRVTVVFGDPIRVAYRTQPGERVPDEVLSSHLEQLTFQIALRLPAPMKPYPSEIREWFGPEHTRKLGDRRWRLATQEEPTPNPGKLIGEQNAT